MKLSPIYCFLILIFSSCSSVSEKDCKNINWANQGKEDASNGDGRSLIEKYKSDCKEHGVTVEEDKYNEAHKQALTQTCTFKKNFDLGLKGAPENKACSELDPNFKDAYETGFREFNLHNKRVDRAKEKEKKMALERDVLRAKILKTYSKSKKCEKDSECMRTYQCLKNNCEITNKYCRFDSDCDIQGKCRTITYKTPTYREFVSEKLCQFKQ
ncbi:DUF2799 domain-containing protein [Bacteriovoracaceae bacterium]|nr:DUF2799 domain-containing protein [Bacteriovoracaceae bacterium]